jgi:hypothetical protein
MDLKILKKYLSLLIIKKNRPTADFCGENLYRTRKKSTHPNVQGGAINYVSISFFSSLFFIEVNAIPEKV